MNSEYLYILRVQEFLKIGITGDISGRVSQISCSCPYDVEIVKSYPVETKNQCKIAEKLAHSELKERGFHHKLEWFRCDAETAMEICQRSIDISLKKVMEGASRYKERAANILKITDPEYISKFTEMPLERISEIISQPNCIKQHEATKINLIMESL